MSEGGASEGQDKSFEPTQARLEKARREGDVPQSKEANAAAAYAGLYIVITAAAGGIAIGLAKTLQRLWEQPEVTAALIFSNRDMIREMAGAIIGASISVFAVPALCVLGSLFAQQAVVAAPGKLKAKWSRLSIIGNIKQKFGPAGLGEFAKSAAKLFMIMAIFAILFVGRFEAMPATALLPSQAALNEIQEEAVLFIGLITLSSTALAAIDIPWMNSQYRKRMMMSFEEIKQESKDTEGDQAMKQNRRQRANAIATNRMLLDVPKADVIIVNPTHYAVALKWKGPKSGAPVCVAKGADELASKIREIASKSSVPIRRDPPTARAIFGVVEVGEEIRREHYAAVASAIHFAEAIRKAAKSG